MSNPILDTEIKSRPLSGLPFRWAFLERHTEGEGDLHCGPDGVTVGENMVIFWSELETALTSLLGYSYRDTTSQTPNGSNWLRRKLPWQHPYMNQTFIKNVRSVKGLQSQGNGTADFLFGNFGVGRGAPMNFGPWAEFKYAILTLEWWRPPYYVRTDADVVDADGNPQEWLRYVDKDWHVDTQMLVREGCQFLWADDQGISTTPGPPGAVGTPVTHSKLTKRWYQVPEASVFDILNSGAVNGEPGNQLYMQTATTNPITGYVQTPSSTTSNAAYRAFPINGTVNSPLGGGVDDSDPNKRFFGCRMGTLRLDGVEFIKRELQLPPFLMQIPFFRGNEPISQQQYDIVFHFDKFDPTRATSVATSAASVAASGALVREAYRGHNLVPRAGDGMFYAIVSQNNVQGGTKKATPFNYSVFHDLFRSL